MSPRYLRRLLVYLQWHVTIADHRFFTVSALRSLNARFGTSRKAARNRRCSPQELGVRAAEYTRGARRLRVAVARDVGMAIRALKNTGYFQTLAEPNLIAYNGQEASFLAGGEFPVPFVSGASGRAWPLLSSCPGAWQDWPGRNGR